MPKSPFLLLLLLLAACSNPAQHDHLAQDTHTQNGQPTLHAIHDDELHQLMLRMDSLMHERFMTETELDGQRRKYARQIADAALSLSQTVSAILAKMPTLALQPAEQSSFTSLASKLQQQTQQLHQLASQNHIDAIDDTLHQIKTTCTSCHALFRKNPT